MVAQIEIIENIDAKTNYLKLVGGEFGWRDTDRYLERAGLECWVRDKLPDENDISHKKVFVRVINSGVRYRIGVYYKDGNNIFD